jgi:hypothetical protein
MGNMIFTISVTEIDKNFDLELFMADGHIDGWPESKLIMIMTKLFLLLTELEGIRHDFVKLV